jgi:hypothetical protein
MGTIIKGTRPVGDSTQWVFLLVDVDANSCEFTHVAPPNLSGQELQDYINAREESYKLDILSDMYPEIGRLGSIEEFKALRDSKDGKVKIKKKNDQGEEVEIEVEKTPWTNRHPPPSIDDRLTQLEGRVAALESGKTK